MNRAEVQRIFSATPFTPVLVRMVSGCTYDVRTPESVIGRRHAAFLVEDGLIALVALEFMEEIRPLTNGHRRSGGAKRRRKRS